MSSETAIHWITALVAISSFVAMYLSQRSSAAEIRGTMTQRINGHDKSIETIEGEQVRQWQEIGQHSKDIAGLQAQAAAKGHD